MFRLWNPCHPLPNSQRSILVHHVGSCGQNLLYLCEVPLLVAQRACTSSLKPALNAVQVEHVSAVPPSDAQTGVVLVACGIGLVLDAGLVQVVAADRAGVSTDGSGP